MNRSDFNHIFVRSFYAALAISIGVSLSTQTQAQTASEIAHEVQGVINELPPYYLVPKSTWTEKDWNDSQLPSGSVVVSHQENIDAGLRIIPFMGSKLNRDQDRNLRKRSAEELAAAGVIQDGDILLTFRPENSGRLTFLELQLGITRAAILGLDSTKNGSSIVRNLEVPANQNGNLDAHRHYNSFPEELGHNLRFLHILRPRFTAEQRENLKRWMDRFKEASSRIGHDSNMESPKFNSNDGYQFIHSLARIALGAQVETKVSSSEFVFGVLALASCDPEHYDRISEQPDRCIQPLFQPMAAVGDGNSPGLVDGPEAMMKRMNLVPSLITEQLNTRVLAENSASAEVPGDLRSYFDSTKTLMQVLRVYHQFNRPTLLGTVLNTGIAHNYTPASFMIQTTVPDSRLQYVGTLYYY